MHMTFKLISSELCTFFVNAFRGCYVFGSGAAAWPPLILPLKFDVTINHPQTNNWVVIGILFWRPSLILDQNFVSVIFAF